MISHNPQPETWEEYLHAMQVFAVMPEEATKGEIRKAIIKMLMAKRKAENSHTVYDWVDDDSLSAEETMRIFETLEPVETTGPPERNENE